jgi:hypothetical protein
MRWVAPDLGPAATLAFLILVAQVANTRLQSMTDIQERPPDVRFNPESGHRETLLGCPLSANSWSAAAARKCKHEIAAAKPPTSGMI